MSFHTKTFMDGHSMFRCILGIFCPNFLIFLNTFKMYFHNKSIYSYEPKHHVRGTFIMVLFEQKTTWQSATDAGSSTNYWFSHHDENRKHLFLQSQFVCSIWPTIQVASSMYLPYSVDNICGNFLNNIDYKDKILIWVGPVVLLLSLWLGINKWHGF
jgi:hypothetical protein